MSQPPARPWFRLASIMRPAPPPPTRPPAPPPVQPPTFRPPPPRPTTPSVTPRASVPPSPVPPSTPAPMSSPVASPPPRATAPPSPMPPTAPAPMSSPVAAPRPRATAPPSPTPPAPPPQVTALPPSPAKTPPATLTSPSTQSPKSPAKTGGIQPAPSTTRRSPTITPAQLPPPPISSKPTSPITKTSSSLPASPGEKASPKIAATRLDVSHTSLPPSPKTKPSAPPPSPLPTSPAFQTVPSSPAPPQRSPVPAAAPIATVAARAATPIASPKIDKPWVETPPQSTKEKLLSYPPSPLTLPPAQLKPGSDLEPIPAEVEQKTVLLQETDEKSTSKGHPQRPHGETQINNIAQHGKRELKKEKGVLTHKKHSDSEEFGMRVVTLAGENKGAIMELSPSRKKYGSGAWSNGGQKLKSNSDEGSSRMKDEKHRAVSTETAPMDAFINCNVQGVNNSILHNSSCTHSDPGVHLYVSRNGKRGHGVHHMKDPVIG